MPSSSITLSDLYFGRDLWIHQRCPTIRVDHLPGNPASFLGTKECNDVADIRRRPQASHRCPTAVVPVPNEFLELLGQRVHNAVFRPSRADCVHRDTPFRNGYSEIPDE